ncbi:Enoyl-CoA hydratase/isomerase [Kribbella flavida DSM 17836]|uniref:Enoyl-CoA hydratase/isomerase n=1 Tax=Kribbella flavida (strain DSM 17836 / JCM 10339 / NBRC 14399) TaxID=479435 RepID=D2PMU2_KRIFD|nr:enoyl-CoA hydratase [Kribbella flavida]ADB32644.1 Enoyl-CoA hydratase/isomerase [Kribbella flavida DSM 17836]
MSSLDVERDGPVLRLTLSNPERRNAITWPMYDGLAAVEPMVATDPGIRVVVLRGAGGEAFAAGTDIRQFADFVTGEQGVEYERRIAAVLRGLLRIRVPVVGVVEGPAVGAGLALAACCDLVVATPDAVFGAPVARTLGNTLPPLVIARLQQRLGAGRTMAMLLTARLLPATEALTAGFVTELVARDALDQHVEDLLQVICANAPLTLASLKEFERRILRDGPAAEADDLLAEVYGSRDFRAGVQAFLAHEPIEWEGR